jgi:hypothetical protein
MPYSCAPKSTAKESGASTCAVETEIPMITLTGESSRGTYMYLLQLIKDDSMIFGFASWISANRSESGNAGVNFADHLTYKS